MIKVAVSNFSCIESADFELGPITVLIGPQASGKSILCKLSYFFIDILQQQARLISDGVTFDSYKNFIKERFHEWFPLSAWGDALFVIEFKAGNCEIRLSRTSYRSVPSDNFRLWTSESLKSHYAGLLRIKSNSSKQSKISDDDFDFELMMTVHDAARKDLSKLLGDDFISGQLFVPAGRSFFTSIGKAVSAFEHGRILDPLILSFGRIYAQLRDNSIHVYGKKSPHLKSVATKLNDIFGGEFKTKGSEEFVLSNDGRRIPLSALSSGQQELLPLIAVLPRLLAVRGDGARMLTYIEEPEAHLFPGAQSRLIEALGSIVNYSEGSLNMVLTTHSPYVLSKFNNLIKAGQLAASVGTKKKEEIDKIIPKNCQMPKDQVRAYAIVDRKLVDIIDSDGLIAADYLDEVSGDISNEFSNLLGIEFSQ